MRDLIRLRRDVEAEKASAGIWARQAEEEFKHRIMLPQSLLKNVKMIVILALVTFIYAGWLCGHKTTACQNSIFKALTAQDRFLYLLYFSTTFLHLGAIVLMFSCFNKPTVLMSLVMGVVSLIWHIVTLVLYFTNNQNEDELPITDAM